MTLLIETNADRWTRLTRGTGIAGLVSIVLLFAPIIAISSLGEPAFLASAEQARAFFIKGSAGWAAGGDVADRPVGDRTDLVRGRTVPAAWPGRGEPAIAVGGRACVWGPATRVPAAGCELGRGLVRQR
jgi:hypothetical protein